MFGFLFGWKNASKCKKLVRQIQCRLDLLKNKRYTIVKHLRQDIAQLVEIGDEERALKKAEQVCEDETLMAIYELLDKFCNFIITHISYIRKHRQLPKDINEAVSSIVFASARCGDVPELRAIRTLFVERYGQKFVTTAMELLPGNLVNSEIVEKLSAAAVSDVAKYRLVDEIAKDLCPKQEILALEYTSEFLKEANARCKTELIPEMLTDNVAIEPARDQDLEGIETEAFKFDFMDPRLQERQESESIRVVRHGDEPEMKNQASSAESSVRVVGQESLVYLDDVEEIESSVGTDQRLFKFKPSVLTRSIDTEKSNLDQESSFTVKPESRTPRNNMKRKRSRRRSSGSGENFAINDTECVVYYNKLRKNSMTGRRKQRKKSQTKSSCYIVNNVFTYGDERINGCDGPKYLRANTMPVRQKREEEICRDGFGRSNSCGFITPKHVHPKLPEYDEIAAKFMALRKEHMQSKMY